MTPETIASWLRNSAAFKNAPDEAIAELAAAFTERRVKAGEFVVSEGESGGEFFLLASGSLNVSSEKDGQQRQLGTVTEGDTFGEIASLTGGRRMASVAAAEDSTLLVLPQAVFLKTVQKHPGLASAVLSSLERYLVP